MQTTLNKMSLNIFYVSLHLISSVLDSADCLIRESNCFFAAAILLFWQWSMVLLFSYSLCLFLFYQLSLHQDPSRLSTYSPLNVPGLAINHWFPTASHALPPICQHLMRHTTSCNLLCTNKPLTSNNLAFSAIEGRLKDTGPEGDWLEGPGKNCKSI